MDSFYVQWHMTSLCNLRCRHCYQDDFSARADSTEAGLKKIAHNLLTAIGGWNRKACVHLTGGEPLLKPELFPLLGDLDRSPVVEEIGIITNGLLLDPSMVASLSAFPKLKKIKISLDGPDAATNDSVRPVGTFQRVKQNLSFVKNQTRFETILMFTAMNRNFRSLPSFLRSARDWGVKSVIIERFIPWGRGVGIKDEVLTKENWQILINLLYEFIGLELEEDFSPYQAFQVEFRNKDAELLGAPCVLGSEGLCLMPDGTVFPCRRFPLPIGNLLMDSLKTIWEKSEVLEKVRKKENLKGKCGNCPNRECTGCRSLAFALTGDFLAEDPHCGYKPDSPSLPGN